jgi:hypothetical protein
MEIVKQKVDKSVSRILGVRIEIRTPNVPRILDAPVDKGNNFFSY